MHKIETLISNVCFNLSIQFMKIASQGPKCFNNDKNRF